MGHSRLFKVQIALNEIRRITGEDNPELALENFANRCEPGINQYWLPFYTFRCFFTFELTPRIISDYRVGNAFYRSYVPPLSMNTRQVEMFMGVGNLSKLIRVMASSDQSLIVEHLVACAHDDEFNLLDIGTMYSIFHQNGVKCMYIPEVVVSAANCCIGMNVAHLIATAIFDQ